jgi:hypothetical protein
MATQAQREQARAVVIEFFTTLLNRNPLVVSVENDYPARAVAKSDIDGVAFWTDRFAEQIDTSGNFETAKTWIFNRFIESTEYRAKHYTTGGNNPMTIEEAQTKAYDYYRMIGITNPIWQSIVWWRDHFKDRTPAEMDTAMTGAIHDAEWLAMTFREYKTTQDRLNDTGKATLWSIYPETKPATASTGTGNGGSGSGSGSGSGTGSGTGTGTGTGDSTDDGGIMETLSNLPTWAKVGGAIAAVGVLAMLGGGKR